MTLNTFFFFQCLSLPTNNHKQFQVLLFLAAAAQTYLLSFDLRGLLGNGFSHFNYHLSYSNRLSIGLSLLGRTERHDEQQDVNNHYSLFTHILYLQDL